MDERERAEWVTLGLLPHVGGKLFRTLLGVFSTPRAVLDASYDDLRSVAGVGPKIATALINAHVEVDATFKQLRAWQLSGVQILTWEDALYPTALQALTDSPPVLFVRGHWTNPPLKSIAIVGTRSPSEAAERLTLNLARKLVNHGWTVVSGLASGVDRAAHFGAFSADSRPYPTVAFLGSGVMRPYPPENKKLTQDILVHGAIFSEVAPYNHPSTPALVARNRLISGFSSAIVIVETGDPGGAMHAARFAKDQLRPIYTFDFPVAGNQRLVSEGHRCITPDHAGIQLLLDELDRL